MTDGKCKALSHGEDLIVMIKCLCEHTFFMIDPDSTDMFINLTNIDEDGFPKWDWFFYEVWRCHIQIKPWPMMEKTEVCNCFNIIKLIRIVELTNLLYNIDLFGIKVKVVDGCRDSERRFYTVVEPWYLVIICKAIFLLKKVQCSGSCLHPYVHRCGLQQFC